MDLREFIKETLVGIVGGVLDARVPVEEMKGQVNPAWSTVDPAYRIGDLKLEIVKFDVALTVTDATTTDGKIRVAWMGIGAGAGGQSASTNQVVSRVQFSVPVGIPVGYENTGRKP